MGTEASDPIREALDEILAAIADLREDQLPAAPLDAKALQERGYSQHEAYALLRAHGVRLPGGKRMRISPAILGRIERGEEVAQPASPPPVAQNPSPFKKKGVPGSAVLYTSEQLREILGISYGTFWKYVRRYPHDFRTFRSGRWRVMTHEDLEHWIEFRKQEDF